MLIDMDEERAETVAVFLGEHVDKLMVLMQHGFFNIKNGSMTIHFGNDGNIRKIERHDSFTLS